MKAGLSSISHYSRPERIRDSSIPLRCAQNDVFSSKLSTFPAERFKILATYSGGTYANSNRCFRNACSWFRRALDRVGRKTIKDRAQPRLRQNENAGRFVGRNGQRRRQTNTGEHAFSA